MSNSLLHSNSGDVRVSIPFQSGVSTFVGVLSCELVDSAVSFAVVGREVLHHSAPLR